MYGNFGVEKGMQSMAIRNIVMFDSNHQEAEEFIRGLQNATGMSWEAKVLTANKGRVNKFYNIVRYIKYFIFPFKIFLSRKKYDNVIGWQAFYGLIFAFYCRLFHVKKVNSLLIKNFVYKPKKGIIGKIYFSFMKYIVKSKYVDIFVCSSKSHLDYCVKVFEEPGQRFVFLPFGINDFAKRAGESKAMTDKYVLSLGRSNRDWDFLIDSFADTEFNLKIICDELYRENVPANIEILNDVWKEETHEYIRNSQCMIIPILNGEIASGETVLLLAMSFSKPIIITKPSALADDYIVDGETGLIVNKNKEELLDAVRKLYNDKGFSQAIAKNGRILYEKKHSLFTFGTYVGKTLIDKGVLR